MAEATDHDKTTQAMDEADLEKEVLKKLEEMLPNCLKDEGDPMTLFDLLKTSTTYMWLLSLCKTLDGSLEQDAFRYGLQMIEDARKAQWETELVDFSAYDHLLEREEGTIFSTLKQGIFFDVGDLMMESGTKHATPLINSFHEEAGDSSRNVSSGESSPGAYSPGTCSDLIGQESPTSIRQPSIEKVVIHEDMVHEAPPTEVGGSPDTLALEPTNIWLNEVNLDSNPPDVDRLKGVDRKPLSFDQDEQPRFAQSIVGDGEVNHHNGLYATCARGPQTPMWSNQECFPQCMVGTVQSNNTNGGPNPLTNESQIAQWSNQALMEHGFPPCKSMMDQTHINSRPQPYSSGPNAARWSDQAQTRPHLSKSTVDELAFNGVQKQAWTNSNVSRRSQQHTAAYLDHNVDHPSGQNQPKKIRHISQPLTSHAYPLQEIDPSKLQTYQKLSAISNVASKSSSRETWNGNTVISDHTATPLTKITETFVGMVNPSEVMDTCCSKYSNVQNATRSDLSSANDQHLHLPRTSTLASNQRPIINSGTRESVIDSAARCKPMSSIIPSQYSVSRLTPKSQSSSRRLTPIIPRGRSSKSSSASQRRKRSCDIPSVVVTLEENIDLGVSSGSGEVTRDPIFSSPLVFDAVSPTINPTSAGYYTHGARRSIRCPTITRTNELAQSPFTLEASTPLGKDRLLNAGRMGNDSGVGSDLEVSCMNGNFLSPMGGLGFITGRLEDEEEPIFPDEFLEFEAAL